MLALEPLPVLADNYVWIAVGADPAVCVVVDPGVAPPVAARLAVRGLRPEAILVTHRHADHVGGASALAAEYGVPVIGPAREAAEVVTRPVDEGDRVACPGLGVEFEVLHIPGHTLGHIAFVGGGALFCGDTLFSAGCGRMFEGTPSDLHGSLQRLAALPPETRVCCGHEYTEANLRFAAAVLPGDPDVTAYAEKVAAWRRRGLPSLPSTVGLERRVNPFLRLEAPRKLELPREMEQPEGWPEDVLPGTVAAFVTLRRWKDGFR